MFIALYLPLIIACGESKKSRQAGKFVTINKPCLFLIGLANFIESGHVPLKAQEQDIFFDNLSKLFTNQDLENIKSAAHEYCNIQITPQDWRQRGATNSCMFMIVFIGK